MASKKANGNANAGPSGLKSPAKPSAIEEGNSSVGVRGLQRSEVRLLRVLVTAGIFGAALIALGYMLHGKTGLEKSATKLVMPVGVLWLLLSGVLIQQCLRSGLARSLPTWCLWTLLTVASTAPLPDACLRYLESRETVFRPNEDPDLDVLVVLGGGTSQGPTRAQAGGGGDRVVYAAQLFLSGRTKRLITTGDAIQGFTGTRTSPKEHTLEIWTALGIPRSAIGTLSGLNTSQEMQSLKAIMPELQGQRIGLLTSASHLPRAMRLARAQGLSNLVPVAADYQSNSVSYGYTDFLPSASALDQLARCQHEFMAKLLGR